MKKTFYRMAGWVMLLVGAIFVIFPVIPGIPVLLLSAYLFSLA
jgi:uncharacterized membrane protein YbaN (DUF454 family)